MKKKVLFVILSLSLAVNLFLLGKWLFVDQWYTPSEEESVILSELIQKTVESEDYQQIAEKEKIVAIESNINRNKGGVFPYYFNVSVRSNQQTYMFSCVDATCDQVKNSQWTASRYSKEKARLPFSE